MKMGSTRVPRVLAGVSPGSSGGDHPPDGFGETPNPTRETRVLPGI